VPSRPDLARWLAHAARDRVRLDGLSDHAVSEAIYLSDPDGHGIEIYADRPRDRWEGQVGRLLTTLPLDVDDLLGELDDPATEPFERLADGTVMGHVHLQVAEIPGTIAFYRDLLGFDLTAQIPQAAFLSAGGYHHHLGANTWESAGAGPAPDGSATLLHATIVLPDAAERDRVAGAVSDAGHEVDVSDNGPLVRDPSGNALLLAAAGESHASARRGRGGGSVRCLTPIVPRTRMNTRPLPGKLTVSDTRPVLRGPVLTGARSSPNL